MGMPDNCDIVFKYRGTDVRFRLKPSPDYISDCIRRDSFFFDYGHMYEALRDVPLDASVVDVGAHIGSMSLWFARVAEARRIVAIEPDDEHYEMLVDNISLNGLSDLITPVHAAVGATCGRAVCKFRSSFTALNMYRIADAGPVAAVTLDSLVERGVITDADVLKIDVEGYECAVLEGASLFFKRFSPVILVEVWPPGRKTPDPNFDVRENNRRFFGLAEALGYRVARTYQGNEDYLLVRESPRSSCVLQPATAHRRQDDAHTSEANGTDMPTVPVTDGDRSAAEEVPAASGLSRACDGGSEASAAPCPAVGGFGFGGVYAVCFTGNVQRHDALMKELARVGIDSVQVVWGFPSPYRGFLLSHIPHVPFLDSRPGAWGATIAQYEAVKVAYERGQDCVLIVEDDARFLVDVDKVARMLRDAPPDWDVLMLDHFSESYVTPVPASGWAEVNLANSSACYALRRKAMERLIDMYEGPVSGKYTRPVMRASDTFLSREYLGRDVKIYCAIPNLAIQQECGDVSTCGHFPMLQYARAGLDLTGYSAGLSSAVSGVDVRTGGTSFSFGGVYAICYTGNMRRHDELMLELERVGLGAEIVWDFPTPYKRFLLSKIPHIKELETHFGTWGATLRHYAAIKVAYERGQDNVLIMEDDCRFLKDVEAVNRGLMAAQSDWDILMLDHWGHPKPADSPYPVVNGWMRVGEANSTACYVLRRKAMERLIDMYESPVSGKYPNPVMRNCDHWLSYKYLGGDVVIQVAVPNLAVQQYCGDVSNYGGIAQRMYDSIGVDRNLYAPCVRVTNNDNR